MRHHGFAAAFLAGVFAIVPPLTQGARAAGVRVSGAVSPASAPLATIASEFDAPHLGRNVLQLALNATSCAMQDGVVKRPSTLTVIDYSRPSTLPRLWVLDLATHAVVFEELVAHGSGSGENLARQFSNDPESHQSSLGLFVTEDAYTGKNGYSLRLRGLEPSNDRALERAIVIHGAAYVSDETAQALGRLGRSWGCPALRPAVARDVIDRVKGGSVIFAYYPDPSWVQESPFLGGCAAAN